MNVGTASPIYVRSSKLRHLKLTAVDRQIDIPTVKAKVYRENNSMGPPRSEDKGGGGEKETWVGFSLTPQ
jgi:hypothetical protein